MNKYYQRKDILKYEADTHKTLHATMAERANRSLKDRLYKYFSERNTLRWIDVLQSFVDAINRSVCRTTGMRPIDVTEANAGELMNRLYPVGKEPTKAPRFEVGDFVRVEKRRVLKSSKIESKGLATFSDVVYVIDKVFERDPPVYKLRDYFNRPQRGYFYEQQLVKVPSFLDNTARVERILRERRRADGTKEYYVRWMNEGSEYDSWVPEADFDVSLANIIYPYSWPDLGVEEYQYIDVAWTTGVVTRIWAKSTACRTVQDMIRGLQRALDDAAGSMCKQARKRKASSRRKRNVFDEISDEDLEQQMRDSGLVTDEYIKKVGELQHKLIDLAKEKTRKEEKYTTEINDLRDRVKEVEKSKTTISADNIKLVERWKQVDKARKDDLKKHAAEKALLEDQLKTLESDLENARAENERVHAEEKRKRLQADTKQRETLERLQAYEDIVKKLESRIEELERPTIRQVTTTAEGQECDAVSGKPYDLVNKLVTFHYDDVTNRFRLSIDKTHVREVRLSQQLRYALGFEEEFMVNDVTHAEYTPDLHGGIHSLYVYAPQLVEPSLIGDTTAPLLRITKVKGSPSDMVEETYTMPQYHRHQQHGGGGEGPYFAGSLYQRGAGIGSIFASLLRFLVPIAKAAGRELGREGLAVGSRVLGSVAEGQALKKAAINEFAQGARNIVGRTDMNAELLKIIDEGHEKIQRGKGKRKTCQIQKRDGVGWVPLTAQDTLVAPIQMLGQSFIRQLKMSINGTEVYDSSTLYPYICYIKNELSYSSNVKDTILAAGGYYRDEAMDNAASAGFLQRNRLMGQSEIVELESRLDFDLANQNLFLLNNLDVLFTIYRHDDNFLIQSLRQGDTNTYRLKVHNIRLRVKTVDVNTAVNLAVGNTLEKTMAKYPVRKTEIRSCYLTPGRTEFVYTVFSHTRPRRIIGAMVNNNAYNGRLTLSPFKFSPFDVRTFEINVGGEIFPSFSYNMRWVDVPKSFVRAFMDMHEGSMTDRNTTNAVTMEQFADGWNFHVFPLTSTLEDNAWMEPVHNCTTTVIVRFNRPIPDPGVSLIIMGEFDQILYIDQHRTVVADGSVV
ncbi:CBN-RNR-2 protein [Aphelenchoides avenae]|nr:CBN-RNR-2 protein [Aphelenchus avenae]